jgi:hypothetical protein
LEEAARQRSSDVLAWQTSADLRPLVHDAELGQRLAALGVPQAADALPDETASSNGSPTR